MSFVLYGLVILAVTVNCATVYLQKRYKVYDRFGEHAHAVHAWIISLFWVLFVAYYMYFELVVVENNFYQNTYVAVGLKVVSIAMFILAMRQIGSGALTNKDLFTNKQVKLQGIYAYVKEPIYLSYTLFILSSGFLTGDKTFYYLSIVSFVGLYIIESRIESLD